METEKFEITFRGGGPEDQLIITRTIEELKKQGIEARRDQDTEEYIPDTWWKGKLWMIPFIFPYCRINEDSCFDITELECPSCGGFCAGCKGCMSKVCDKRCVCILIDPDTREITSPDEAHIVPPKDRRVYNIFSQEDNL